MIDDVWLSVCLKTRRDFRKNVIEKKNEQQRESIFGYQNKLKIQLENSVQVRGGRIE